MREKYYEKGERKQRTPYHRPTRSIPMKKDILREEDYMEELEDLNEEDV